MMLLEKFLKCCCYIKILHIVALINSVLFFFYKISFCTFILPLALVFQVYFVHKYCKGVSMLQVRCMLDH